jgi:hypothetical protein
MAIGAAAGAARRAALGFALIAIAVPAARANAPVLATEPNGASAPTLWNGGVAWWSHAGIRYAEPGSAPRLLERFPEYGDTDYYRVLDGGAGAGVAGGPLAYGWYEVPRQTPPVSPRELNAHSLAISYLENVLKRGLIAASGAVSELPECNVKSAIELPTQLVSLGGSSLAYGCAEASAATNTNPPYVALANVSTPGTAASKLAGVKGAFQISGSFIAYQAGEPSKESTTVVKNLATNALAYETPQVPAFANGELALQEDGSLVLLGSGLAGCPQANESSRQTFPAEWFSLASPVAHQLGCFYAGVLRPVAGKWVAIAPGPGNEASLVLVELASGSRSTLAVFPDPGMLESHQRPGTPLLDFDGTRLAWVQETCAGAAVQLAPDVHAMSPGPVPSEICPVQFHIHGALHAKRNGNVRVPVSCPLGCQEVFLEVLHPRPLFNEIAGFFSLPPSSTPRVESFHLSRGELAYVRKHRRVRITLAVQVDRLGEGAVHRVQYKTQATLVR